MHFINRTTLDELKRLREHCINTAEGNKRCRNKCRDCIFQTDPEFGACIFSCNPKWWRLDDIQTDDIYDDREEGAD